MTDAAVTFRGAAVPSTVGVAYRDRFAMLDGWRAASIVLVLAGHLLPIGPRSLTLNGAAAATGMVLFFILSGFLITRFLASDADIKVFVIRRFFRIVPLAWLVMAVLLIVDDGDAASWRANLLFYANLPPFRLIPGGAPLWSLCVEMQFYVGIATFVAIAGSRALIALPLVALGVTAGRIVYDQPISIVTWFRVDEILAGGTLALVYAGRYGRAPQRLLAWLNPVWLLPLVFAASHPAFGPLQYARPYLAALTIGASLYGAPTILVRAFENRGAGYLASVSYAVYILHGALAESWLGSGSTIVKYAKRPLMLATTFGLAHLSTYRFERPCIALAKRLTQDRSLKINH